MLKNRQKNIYKLEEIEIKLKTICSNIYEGCLQSSVNLARIFLFYQLI